MTGETDEDESVGAVGGVSDGLDRIADTVGTVTDERQPVDGNRLAPDETPDDDRDVQVEYEGGWSNGTPDRDDG